MRRWDEDDPLNAARGIINGLAISVVLWVLLISLVVWALR